MCDIFQFSVLIGMGWKVILPDRYFKPVEKKIHEIAGSVGDWIPDEGGLMSGKTGLACFYAYYSDWSGNRVFDGLVADLIEQALNPAAGHNPRFPFSDGLSGIGWLIDHFSSTGLTNWDAATVFNDLDPHLYEHMMSEIRSGHFDYLHGALGTALYFLRHPRNEKYQSFLSDLVKALHEIAVKDTDGSIKWLSVLDQDANKTGYNLSLSHGLSSIILILAKIHAEKISDKLTGELLRDSMAYLEKQKLPSDKYLSVFPSWAVESTEELRHSRLAWCYGDLGIGFAFLASGSIFPESMFKSDGLNLLTKTSHRRDPEENAVYDAGICHGAAGLALIYNILYQKTCMDCFREAAIYWLDICLNMASHNDGIAGYKAWYHPEFGGWKRTAGILDGASGIGLALMSFISDREPLWAQSLLLV